VRLRNEEIQLYIAKMLEKNVYICINRCIYMYSFYRGKRFHNSLRYPGRDYSRPGKYFVTICTANKTEWFGKIINAEMQLSKIGSIAFRLWCEIPTHFPYITLDEFVIMPNHLHGIIIINKSDKNPVVGSLHATNLRKMKTCHSYPHNQVRYLS